MAIRMMVREDRAGDPGVDTVTDYPGANGPLYLETTYEGCVLVTREENGYDDSDFYAIVWDEETEALKRVNYATTRGWTYPNSATVDATDEVQEKAQEWLADTYEQLMTGSDAAQAERVQAGRVCTVTRTIRRKGGRRVIAEGETVRVITMEPNPFRSYPRGGYNAASPPQRARVELADGERWYLDEMDLRVADPEEYRLAAEEIRARAERAAAQRGWYVPFTRMAVVL